MGDDGDNGDMMGWGGGDGGDSFSTGSGSSGDGGADGHHDDNDSGCNKLELDVSQRPMRYRPVMLMGSDGGFRKWGPVGGLSHYHMLPHCRPKSNRV